MNRLYRPARTFKAADFIFSGAPGVHGLIIDPSRLWSSGFGIKNSTGGGSACWVITAVMAAGGDRWRCSICQIKPARVDDFMSEGRQQAP